MLNKSLKHAEELIINGEKDVKIIIKEMKSIIAAAEDSSIDYIEIVDNNTLQPIDAISREVLIALAVKIGKTRLIDNMVAMI